MTIASSPGASFEDVDVSVFKLPYCPVPRPGERVSWFSGNVRRSGVYQGHTIDSAPMIQGDEGAPVVQDSFSAIRLEDPFQRKGPIWEHLPSSARVLLPSEPQLQRFQELLDQRTPPGPKYLDLVTEIWARGFEVFLVGGTVRDVLTTDAANDVDLVTTMPLKLLESLAQSMYGKRNSSNPKYGFIRIGGKPHSSDPFIDVKQFCTSYLGTDDALFGADIARDLGNRDFACNAIYFDPMNRVLIDTSGSGIIDAYSRVLRLVSVSNQTQIRARIYIRLMKFCVKGYSPEPESEKTIESYKSDVQGLDDSVLVNYVQTQFLSKSPQHMHEKLLYKFKEEMERRNAIDVWNKKIEPFLADILRGNSSDA